MSFRFWKMLLINGYTILYTSAEIPPAGAPSGFDSAAIVTLALAITWRCRSAQNDTWVVCCVSCNILIRQSNIHPNRNDPRVVPPRSTTNFLPFLSGSGESENVRISLAECGSEQPEFAARKTATPKSAQRKERDINPIELKFLRSRGFFQEAPCGFGQSPRSSPSLPPPPNMADL